MSPSGRHADTNSAEGASRWNEQRDVLGALAAKYVWWPIEGTENDRARRLMAQIMNLGTYEDIRAIEQVYERAELVGVMASAQPGWFSPRSWEFWRGRLSLSSGDTVPAMPPMRSFGADAVQTEA